MRIPELFALTCAAFVLASRAIGGTEALAEPRPGSLSSTGEAPAGLAASDWTSIRAAYEASRHAAFAVEDGYQARNPGQSWRARFDGRGFTVLPDAGGWEWGLELERYGFAGDERAIGEPLAVNASGQRVSYDWDGILEEWYVNDTRGLEHGFTLLQRPEGTARAASRLMLTLVVRGELCSQVQEDRRGVRFVNGEDQCVLSYAGLTVFDADGQELDSRLASAGDRLLISVDERGARYPLTIDPLVQQQAYLKASNAGTSDVFGHSISVSGDTVVVGAPMESSAATGINGDQSSNASFFSGAAYVFVRNGTTWSQQAYLKASNTSASDRFGQAVAVSGDTVLIGSPEEDGSATGINGVQNEAAQNSGAAYVFVRSGVTWSQQAYLKASNTGTNDGFGLSVSLSGETVVVGAYSEDSAATGVGGDQVSNDVSNSGAAYVFVRNGTTWTQEAYLKASNTDLFDNFGEWVGVAGDTVVVATPDEDSSATGVNGDQHNDDALSSGAAYVFARTGTSWSQEAYVKASNTEQGDGFGGGLGISGDTIVLAARGEDSAATGVNGDESDDGASSSGAAYVFVRNGVSWSQEAYLKASNAEAGDNFGFSLAIEGDILAVGAALEDSSASGLNGDEGDNALPDSGAAYVFRRSGTSWSQLAYTKASSPASGDFFGSSIALAGDTLAIGALLEDGLAPESGAAYVFDLGLQALVAFRNGGSNPASYAASPVVIGSTFTATVDNNLAAQLTSLLIAFDTPFLVTLGGGQTLLCLDLGGSGEAFTGAGLAPTTSAGGVDSFALPFANDPSTCGVVFYSQAIQFGSPPFKLSNAQDLTIGSF